MNNLTRIVILVALSLVVGVVFAFKRREVPKRADTAAGESNVTTVPADSIAPSHLPRLVDLGANKCIPCRMMAPILEELKKEYAGRMYVEFIDVWENRGAGEKYGINSIPTQIFYDASGKELSRHEGFIAKEDILARWKELGVIFATTHGTVR